MATERFSARGRLCLSRLNRRVSSPLVIRVAALCVFAAALAAYVAPPALRGELGAPPESGDGPQYDTIALQLAKGNGFSINWDDPDFKAPYAGRNEGGTYDWLLRLRGGAPTAYRPPLLPFMMAASYKVFGRRFGPVRVMNGVFMALACALGFLFVGRRFGLIPGLLFFALFVRLDESSRYYAQAVLTEAPACLLTAAIFLSLLRAAETRGRKWSALLGVLTGAAFLTRTLYLFWVPPLALTLWALTRRRGERLSSAGPLRLPLLFVAAFLAVSAPWMLRNCLLLGRLQPLGTMGGISMSAGYSDEAVAHRGVWFSLDQAGYFDQFPKDVWGLELEKSMSDYGSGVATRWMRQNPSKLPVLALMKVWSEWRPRELKGAALLGFAALGFFILLSHHPREALAFAGLVAACTLGVALTWSVMGRFLFPLFPVLLGLSALGMWSAIIAAAELPLERLGLTRLETDPASAGGDEATARARAEEDAP